MSALRCASRRLVGPRTRAAIVSPATEALQRRLLPRLLHSGPAAGVPHPPTSSCKALDIQKELRQKKEELYDLLAKVELKPYDPAFGYIDRYRNKKLLEQLSVQIEPRHNDLDWRWFQLAHKINFYRIWGTTIFTWCAFWHYDWRGQNGSEDPNGKETAPGMTEDEGHMSMNDHGF